MSRFDELLSKLKSLQLTQSSEWSEDIPEDIWNEYFKDLSREAYKWGTGGYWDDWMTTAMDVVHIEGRYLGVDHVDRTFGSNSISDMNFTLEFYEVEPFETISYRKI